jgi:undecaprenyl-diphosphatase
VNTGGKRSEYKRGVSGAQVFFDYLNAREARIVRILVERSQCPLLRRLSLLMNRLGDGWLYLVTPLLATLLEGERRSHFLLALGLSVGLAFSLYLFLKPRLARLRPCDFDPGLRSPIKALDKYSCPSGHCMTAAAVGLQLAQTFPRTTPVVIVYWLLIAWSRISLGHHYPTDLILGGVIGVGSSWLISTF